MKFRVKAFALHLLSSAAVLSLILGALYLGWYRWPGWYLTGLPHVAAMMVGVDVALGPLLTMVIANPSKPRRELARDVGIIVLVQLVALIYGTSTLWSGRPLYYTFSVDRLEFVQASDLDKSQIELAQQSNPALAPHWYSLPRWIWAPLPDDEKLRSSIVGSAISGGPDVIQMPRFFKPWSDGLPQLRKHLKKAAQFNGLFTKPEIKVLEERLRQLGLPPEWSNTLFIVGRGRPLLAVFDGPASHVIAIVRPD
jgi:hypothetical protein